MSRISAANSMQSLNTPQFDSSSVSMPLQQEQPNIGQQIPTQANNQQVPQSPMLNTSPNGFVDSSRSGIEQYRGMITNLANQYGVPPQVAMAVAMTESGGRANAKSPTGVQGLFQVTKSTMKEMGFDPSKRNDPRVSAEAGIKYLATLNKQYGGNWNDNVFTAYNSGGGGVNFLRTGQWDQNSLDYFKKYGINSNQKGREAANYAPTVRKYMQQFGG